MKSIKASLTGVFRKSIERVLEESHGQRMKASPEITSCGIAPERNNKQIRKRGKQSSRVDSFTWALQKSQEHLAAYPTHESRRIARTDYPVAISM